MRGLRKWPKNALLFVGGLAVVLCGATATAQETRTPQQAEAEELFQAGAEAYNDGEFERAIELLERAHNLFSEPVLLYNLARAYEANGDEDEALDAYRRYLIASPDAEDRGRIESRVESLVESIEERNRLEEERESALAVASQPNGDASGPSALPWIVASAGGLTVAAGAVFGVLSQSSRDEAVEAATHQMGVSSLASAEDQASTANVLFAVGGGLFLLGAVWGVIDLLSSSSEDQESLQVGVGPASLTLEGQF